MIKLEEQFNDGSGGFSAEPLVYKQIKRTEKVALYQRSRQSGKVLDYEVFYIHVDAKGKVIKFPNGTVKVFEDDTENYTSSGKFGKTAWSCSTLESATKRFDACVKESLIPDDAIETVDLIIPAIEFTTGEFATQNNVPYHTAVQFIKANMEMGKIKFLREEHKQAKGKPSKIYAKA